MAHYATALTEDHKQFLRTLFGDEVIFDKAALRVYESDASNTQGEALAAVRPLCTQQVQTFMQWANTHRIAVHPRGRGTSVSGGCVPTIPGIVVSMLAMNNIIEISATDFVAVVEPGVNTATLQAECEKLGLFYPPDPASGKATSVGGNVATCAGGLRAVKYGVTRDYVLGCDVVLPTGEVLHLGGKNQKDVIGLDITRFMVGSEGSLGIITKLYLKLLPNPETSASILAGYPSLDTALASMSKVFAAGILPAAVEFMNETVLDILQQTGDVIWPKSVNALLLFQVDGSQETVPLEIARLGKQLNNTLWQQQGIGTEEENLLWAYRRRVSAASYVLGPDRIGGDMAVPRGQILHAVRRFEAIASKHGKRLIAFGHAGDGNIHANLHYDASNPDDKARTMQAHHELDDAVLEFGGSISGEHGAGSLKNITKQLGKNEIDIMHKIRSVFDPNGILNPTKGY